MKYPDDILIVCDCVCYDFVDPFFGFKFSSDEREFPVLCKLNKEGRYPINHWSYKISLIPTDESLKDSYQFRTFYFNDLCSLLQHNPEYIKLFKTEEEAINYINNKIEG